MESLQVKFTKSKLLAQLNWILQIKRSSAFNKAHQELLLHQKVLVDPIELNKLLSVKMKKRDPPRRLSLPEVAHKSERMPKITQKKHNKSLGAKEDVFDFDESMADLESFPVPEKTYLLKRKFERAETSKKFENSCDT